MIVNLKQFSNYINELDNICNEEDVIIYENGIFSLMDKDEKYDEILSKLNAEVKHKDFLTVSEISKHLKVSSNTVYSLIKENTIPYIDSGKIIKIKTSDYFRFLNECYHTKK